MNTKKMKKAATNWDILLNVVQKVIIVGTAVIFVLAILMLFLGERIISYADISLTLGELSFSPNNLSQVVDVSVWKVGITFNLVASAVLLAFIWYEIRLIRKLFAPMKEGRPFDNGASKIIRRLAWVALIGGIINTLFQFIAMVIETRAIYFTVLFNTDAVSGFSTNYTVDCGFFVAALFLFLLSYVFHYGEELQKESDETL